MTINLIKLKEVQEQLNLITQVQELEDLNKDSFFLSDKIYSAGKAVEYFVDQHFTACTYKTKMAVEAVLAMAIYSHKHKKWCMYSRNNRSSNIQIVRYKNEHMEYRLFINVIDKLIELGFLENKMGVATFKNKFTSRFMATDTLMELLSNVTLERKTRKEPLIVKSVDGLLDYNDTAKSNKIRKDVSVINKHLAGFDWSIELNDNDLQQMPPMCIKDYTNSSNPTKELQSYHPGTSLVENPYISAVDASFYFSKTYPLFAPQYKRIFTTNKQKYNKSEQFNLHGRFYDMTQNVPKALRNNILINGDKTIELDFSSLHLSMIYALEGLPTPDGDLYAIESYPRNIVKKAIIIILNCKSREQSLSVLRFNEEFADYWELAKSLNNDIIGPEDLYTKLEAKHSAIVSYFSSSFGLLAMYHDSSIANNILKAFVSLGKPVMGVHDSFRVRAADELLLKEVMIAAYQNVLCTNNVPGIKHN